MVEAAPCPRALAHFLQSAASERGWRAFRRKHLLDDKVAYLPQVGIGLELGARHLKPFVAVSWASRSVSRKSWICRRMPWTLSVSSAFSSAVRVSGGVGVWRRGAAVSEARRRFGRRAAPWWRGRGAEEKEKMESGCLGSQGAGVCLPESISLSVCRWLDAMRGRTSPPPSTAATNAISLSREKRGEEAILLRPLLV